MQCAPARVRLLPCALAAILVVATVALATEPRIEELWLEPKDIESRDLFHGRGGIDSVPDPDALYRFKGLDTKGHSAGYDVEGPDGRKWDVKIGEEARPEVVVSRILSAVGYHQPVVYFVERWRMSDGPTSNPEPGRFRLASDHKTDGEWSWTDNPFLGTRELHGLLVANLMLENWDFKTSNNRVYRIPHGSPERWFVVQDVGAALGKSRWPVGTRDNIVHFEHEELIKRARSNRVKFDYHARHTDLLRDISPADVAWICRLLDRLSDAQWHDAFRAAKYPEDLRTRYIRKIREKIQQGLALEARAESSR